MEKLVTISNIDCVLEVRGCGLMVGIELRQEDGTRATGAQIGQVTELLQDEGILVVPAEASITLSPSLLISDEEITIVANSLHSVLSRIRLNEGQVTCGR